MKTNVNLKQLTLEGPKRILDTFFCTVVKWVCWFQFFSCLKNKD